MSQRYPRSWTSVFLIGLAGLGLLGWGGYGVYTLVDLLQHGQTVDATSVRAVEGRRGHWTTTFAVEGGECVVDAFHVEPGEHASLLRDPGDPTRCLADAFFPTIYWPLACLGFGVLCMLVAVSDLRKLLAGQTS